MEKRILFIFLSLRIAFISHAGVPGSSWRFRHLDAGSGLPNTFVVDIMQDHTGFIWFATRAGICRYDGRKIKVYQNREDDSTSLSYDYTRCLTEDREGRIWVGTFGGGICCFDKYTEKFTSYRHDRSNPNSICSDKVHKMAEDRSGHLWIATEGGGLDVFDKTTKKFAHYHHRDGDSTAVSSDYLRCLSVDADGTIWVGSMWNGLNAFNPSKGVFTTYRHHPSDPASLSNDSIICLYDDGSGHLYIGTRAGLNVFDKQTGKVVRRFHAGDASHSVTDDRIMTVTKDSYGKLWIGTSLGGLSIYDPATGRAALYKNDPLESGSLSSSRIISLMEDRGGGMWIGTWDGGADFIPAAGNRFSIIRQRPHDSTSLTNGNICCLTADSGNIIWAATLEGGLNRMDMRSNTIRAYRRSPVSVYSLSSDNIWSICIAKDGTVWTGTNGAGLCALDPGTGRIRRYPMDIHDSTSVSSNNISCIYEDSRSNIWVGTFNGGLDLFDRKRKAFTRFLYDPADDRTISSNQIFCITESRDGHLWLGTNGGGLNEFDPQTRRFIRYQQVRGDSLSLNAIAITTLIEDDSGYLWIGTLTGGLNCMDTRHPGSFLHFTRRDGLPGDFIGSMLDDGRGSLWIAGDGIYRFTLPAIKRIYDKTTGLHRLLRAGPGPVQVKRYMADQDIQNTEFNSASACMDRNRRMYFGGTRGIVSFDPDSMPDYLYQPPVLITGFSLFGKPCVLDTNISYKKEIILDYTRNFFSLEFAALSYIAPEMNSYKYKLDGVDNDWVDAGRSNIATYTKIGPGEYTFHVRAANHDGIWSTQEASVRIVITPPFWKTKTFYGLTALVIVLLLLLLHNLRMAIVRKEENQKAAFERSKLELEMKALRAQMNPHFVFNSLNSIERFIASNNPKVATEYLGRFAKLIRLVLENSRHKRIPLAKELQALKFYIELEALRFENKFDYAINVHPSVDAGETDIPPMIIQPFAENAIIHGLCPLKRRGKLTIDLEMNGEAELQITVQDNGVGRPKLDSNLHTLTKTHESLGLQLTRERLSKIQGSNDLSETVTIIDLHDTDGQPAGTRVVIRVAL